MLLAGKCRNLVIVKTFLSPLGSFHSQEVGNIIVMC